RLDKTHKYEGIVRANALTKRKRIQENEYDKILEPNMAKRQKKLKFSDMGNNKETAFYNIQYTRRQLFFRSPKRTTNIWNNSSTEYSEEDNKTSQKPLTNIIESEPMLDMSIQVEQTIEYETAQVPVEKKTQDTIPLQGEYKQRKANLIADNRKEEYDYAPTLNTEIDNVGMNLNNIKEQTQVTIEYPNEKEHQATMSSSLDTNDTEVEMIDPTENDLVTLEVQMSGILNTKDKLVAQHDNSGGQPPQSICETMKI
ncbi:34516_t:CDS:2, partial [Gigaspora margarita]